MAIRFFLLWALIVSFAAAHADEYRKKANEGYDYYKNGEYDKAFDFYKKAGILKPEEELPAIGKGSALYKSKDFDGAIKEFSSAPTAGDDKLAADLKFNIGNAKFQEQDYKGAISSYIDALKLRPEEKDFKQNLELALSKLQEQQQQQQQQGQEGDQQDQGQQGDKGDQQQQSDNNDQQKQDSNKDNDLNKDQQDQQNQQNNQQSQAQQDSLDQQQGQNAQAADEQKMSEEEAKNLLARFEADEQEIQKKLKQVNIGRGSKRDW